MQKNESNTTLSLKNQSTSPQLEKYQYAQSSDIESDSGLGGSNTVSLPVLVSINQQQQTRNMKKNIDIFLTLRDHQPPQRNKSLTVLKQYPYKRNQQASPTLLINNHPIHIIDDSLQNPEILKLKGRLFPESIRSKSTQRTVAFGKNTRILQPIEEFIDREKQMGNKLQESMDNEKSLFKLRKAKVETKSNEVIEQSQDNSINKDSIEETDTQYNKRLYKDTLYRVVYLL